MPDEGASIDQAGRYWDAVVGGADNVPTDLDPGLAAAIHRLHSLMPEPEAAAKERVWQSVLANTEASRRSPNGSISKAISLGTPILPLLGTGSTVSMPRGDRRQRLVVQIATAALLVVSLVGIYFAFGPGRFDRREQAPVFISAIMATPASPVAVDTPVAQFLWQSEGDPALPLDNPTRLAIDPAGNIWVADGQNNQFQIFDPDGTFLEAWGEPGSGDGQFAFSGPGLFGGTGAGAVSFDVDGNIYVSDPGNYRIQKFGPDRRFMTSWGSKGDGDGQFLALLDLVVDGQGRVYAADEGRDDVQVFDRDGRFLAAWAGVGSGPNGIAVDGDGNIWVALFHGHAVKEYSPDGTPIAIIGESGAEEGRLTSPNDVAVDQLGRVYVPEWGNQRLKVLDTEGRFLTQWGEFGNGEGEFNGPNAVVLDEAGDVYVTEDGNDRIQKFRLLPPLAPG